MQEPTQTPPFSQPYAALRAAWPRWREMGASPWVLDVIANGIPIPWVSTPPRHHHPGYPLNAEDAAFMTEQMAKDVAAGYIEEVTGDAATIAALQCISPSFIVRKGRKPRAVLDYTHPNAHVEARRFKYETLHDLSQVLRPDDSLLVWDVKDAYHHLVLREEDRRYLAFTTLGRVFIPITMPFGMSLAPYMWTKVVRALVQYLRSLGFRIISYVDDFGGGPPAMPGTAATVADAERGYLTVQLVFRALGLWLHPDKGTHDGSTATQLLGHIVDTTAGVYRLPPRRAEQIEVLAKGLLRFASAHQRWVRFSTLRVFCGTAVSTTLSVVPARFHLRSLFSSMGYRHARSGDCRLGRQALTDLRWWSGLASSGLTLARPIWPDGPTMLLETDASRIGWGAVLNRSATARGRHSPARADLHINLLELGAIRLGLLSLRALLPSSAAIIRLKCDSMVALGVLQAQSSPSLALMDEYRLLHAVLAELRVELRHEYVQSALNVWADRLSREVDTTDWSLAPVAFHRLDDQCGPHTVDLFATELNTRCIRFCSRDLTPGALGSNALLFSWETENAWANPPVQPLGRGSRQGDPRAGHGDRRRPGVEGSAVVGARGGGVRGMAAAAPRRGGVPRGAIAGDAPARVTFLADCGVPFSRRPGLRNDADRWGRLFQRLISPHVADTHDPAAAAALLQAGHRPATRVSYMSKFRGFLLYCAAHDREPLPASTSTIVGYILWEQQRAKLAPPSLDKYLSAVKAVHVVAGLPDPLAHYLVRLARFGFCAGALERADGLRPQRLPLPAAWVLAVVDFGLAATDPYLRLQAAGLTLAYLLFNRPGAAACVRAQDLRFTNTAMEAQRVDFKMAVRTGRERHTFSVPYNGSGKSDRPIVLLRRVLAEHHGARRHPAAMLFADPAAPPTLRIFHLAARVTGRWLARLREAVPLRTPLGGVYQGHSVRKGAASEAYALGVPVAVIAELLGHVSTQTSLQHYILTRWRASVGAWELLGRYTPPSYLRL